MPMFYLGDFIFLYVFISATGSLLAKVSAGTHIVPEFVILSWLSSKFEESVN